MPQLIHNDFMKRNILQNLFLDHYEEIQYTLHPRKTEMENIDKMLNCGDPAYGGAMYGCPDCDNFNHFTVVLLVADQAP